MDRVTIGIPRGYFYKYHNFFKYYFEYLGFNIRFSKKTDKEILELGKNYSNSEMCMSLKTFLGHVAYLQDKCDYILIPRIDNYGRNNQMCTNFMAIYDLVNNTFDKPILNFNINYEKKLDEYKGLKDITKKFGISLNEIKKAYRFATIKNNKILKRMYIEEYNKLKSDKIKILLFGHDYNCHDDMLIEKVIKYLKNMKCEIIYSDQFPLNKTISLSKNICKYLYWRNNKEEVGALELCKDKIDGVIMITSFPCGPDSLVNDLVMRKVKIPILDLVIDDMDNFTGIETRLESFLDVINSRKVSKCNYE